MGCLQAGFFTAVPTRTPPHLSGSGSDDLNSNETLLLRNSILGLWFSCNFVFPVAEFEG